MQSKGSEAKGQSNGGRIVVVEVGLLDKPQQWGSECFMRVNGGNVPKLTSRTAVTATDEAQVFCYRMSTIVPQGCDKRLRDTVSNLGLSL
jgi:hypothetical protein